MRLRQPTAGGITSILSNFSYDKVCQADSINKQCSGSRQVESLVPEDRCKTLIPECSDFAGTSRPVHINNPLLVLFKRTVENGRIQTCRCATISSCEVCWSRNCSLHRRPAHLSPGHSQSATAGKMYPHITLPSTHSPYNPEGL